MAVFLMSGKSVERTGFTCLDDVRSALSDIRDMFPTLGSLYPAMSIVRWIEAGAEVWVVISETCPRIGCPF